MLRSGEWMASLCLWGEIVHGRYRKALAMLSNNAYRHHDAQQRQSAGFHTAPLVKVTFGIKILKLILILILTFSNHCAPLLCMRSSCRLGGDSELRRRGLVSKPT